MIRLAALLACSSLVVSCTAPESSPGDAGTADSPGDAGGSDPQRDYAYEGCAPSDQYCPNLLTYRCAIEKIRAKYDACSGADDCAVIAWDDCVGIGSCGGLAVAKTQVGAFSIEAGAQKVAYCTGATCRSSGSCAWIANVPACRDGRCQAESADAGTRDAGSRARDAGSGWCRPEEGAGEWHVAPPLSGLSLLDVSVPFGVTYWEVRRGTILEARAGTLCVGVADREPCESGFASRAGDAATANCNPADCVATIAWQSPEAEAVGLSGDAARAFLGTITSEAEAVLFAWLSGYATEEGPHDGVRTTSAGFEVVGTRVTSVCDPIRTERHRLAFAPAGTFEIECRATVSEQFGVCL